MTTKALLFRTLRMGVDAFDDLHCTRVDVSDADTYSSATATENTNKINEWVSRVAYTGGGPALVIPWGFIAINGTLGDDTGKTISGYNGDASIRGWPSCMSIIVGGGQHIGRYHPGFEHNANSGGFMWVGDADTPMIRMVGNGCYMNFSAYGYQYVTGSTLPSTRARAAIELKNLPTYVQCGHHTFDVHLAGFEKGVWCHTGGDGGGHCDHLQFQRLVTRDCTTTFYSDQNQAVNHHFDMVEHYCPDGRQSTVFDYQDGGNMTVDHVSVTGDYGMTLLRTNAASYNVGYYQIGGIIVDRSFFTATMAGNGYFRLHEHQGDTPYTAHFKGRLCFGSTPWPTNGWYNADDSSAFDITPAAGSVYRRVTAEVTGLDTQDTADWRDFEELTA